jgi:hypothetical protein
MKSMVARVASAGLALIVALALTFGGPSVSHAAGRGGGGGHGASGGGRSGGGGHGGHWSGHGGHWSGHGGHWSGHGGHWSGHGGWWGGHGGWWGGWWDGFYPLPYYYPYTYAYPYPTYAYPYPYYDYSTSVAMPPASDKAQTVVQTPSVQREVVYPNGKYVLYGDGVTEAWQWVWVPATPAPHEPH